MVKPSYFTGKNYITQDEWQKAWESCLGVEYPVIVDIRAVRKPETNNQEDIQKAVISAAVEVIKYTTKPSELIVDVKGNGVMSNRAWLVELTSQLFRLKRIATGGVLKEYYKVLEEDDDQDVTDLLNLDEDDEVEADADSPRVCFDYSKSVKRYKVRPDSE
jgi:plasmid rolling circle replication initiator protein Rep